MYLKFVAIVVLIATSPCFAADQSRKIDFTSVILDQDDKPIIECVDNPPPKDGQVCISSRPITLGAIALSSLAMSEPGLKPEESVKRGALGLELYKATAIELSPEDIVLLKQQIAKRYSPFFVVRAFRLIDPTTK